jgi:uncharacterized protein (TIGR00299 family) protein
MRIAYFDCFAGVSGDMVLGALLDAGLPVDALREELGKLPLGGYTIEVQKAIRQEFAGTHASVLSPPPNMLSNGHGPDDAANHAPDQASVAASFIETIKDSTLSEEVTRKVLVAIRLLVEAESYVQGNDPSSIPPHELSSLDTLIEIAGAVVGLSLLGIDRVECSHLNVGGGFVKTDDDGTLPVPTPVTAEILRAVSAPVYGTSVNKELVTPAGAAIIAAITSNFGSMPRMKMDKVGYGAGKADIAGNPNLLRVTIGDVLAQPAPATSAPHERTHRPDEEWVTLLEANLDDMNPRYYDFLMYRLAGHGALDVFLAPVQMREHRPGVVLSVLCKPEHVDTLASIIFEETSTLGLRISDIPRRILQWEEMQAQTPWGPIKVQVARGAEGKILHVKPDFDDVKKLALEMNLPIDHVYEEARRAWGPHMLDGHQQVGRFREKITRN